MSGHPSSRQEAVSPAEPDSIYHLAHEWGSVDTVGNTDSQTDAGFSNAGHWDPSAGDLDDMDDADMDDGDDDDDGEEEDGDEDEYDDEDDRFDNDDSGEDGHNIELQFSVYPAQGDTTAATAAGPGGEGQPQNPERVRSMGSNISLAWNLQISFPFGLLIGLLLVTTAQLFRLIGATELHRILQGHGVLRSRSNENGQGYDIYGVQATRRTRRTGPSRYPKPPSQTGRELMISGDYGSNPYYVDRLKGRKKKLATSLMYRELGAGPRGTEIRSSRELSQRLIPGTAADTIIHYENPCYSGQFSDDGNFFFVTSQDFNVRMYDTSNPYIWKHYKTVEYPIGQWTITDATLSPDNKSLAYSSIRNIVCLAGTDPASSTDPILLSFEHGPQGAAFNSMFGTRFGIWSVRFSGDGREIVAGTSGNSVLVYDLETQRTILQLRKHSDDVNAVCYGDKMSPHILYSGSDDSTIRVCDRRSMADGREAGVFVGHTEGITFVDSKGDGRYVLSNSKDQTMKLWDLRKMMTTAKFDGMNHIRYSTGFDYRFSPYLESDYIPHPDDCSVVTFHGHGVLRTLIRCHFSPPGSTDSRYVYTGSHDGKVYVYNMDATLAKVIDVGGTTRHSWSPRGTPRSYDLDPKEIKTCVRDVSWHPNAPVIAATSWNGWGMSEGTCTVHSWTDDAEDDEGLPSMGWHLESELQLPAGQDSIVLGSEYEDY
ncbi:hypothetical protein TRV_05575 [Trichophyton verrucosum HKI 0517]|uniref:Uncharacterized protein n=1 Tax=Trichophyton verrucosum (strain HKI 0517) TaxID=663202 RepID=D4DEK8_TRIVH|nr:uncharacterized protein TRV_05575 [Trichophyton verrucosum HKI 0517]EFE39713.1 hypothetical protein TRV_05575 [Trichophyton verrucosum HKI 0517]